MFLTDELFPPYRALGTRLFWGGHEHKRATHNRYFASAEGADEAGADTRICSRVDSVGLLATVWPRASADGQLSRRAGSTSDATSPARTVANAGFGDRPLGSSRFESRRPDPDSLTRLKQGVKI